MHPAVEAPRVSVRLLGPLEVTGPGGPLCLSGRRQRTLLAVLALRAPAVVSRPQLVDALWGTRPPPTAVKTLHSHLARVRQALEAVGLGDLLVTVEPGYALRLPPGWLDLARFEEHVRTGRAALRSDPAAAAAELRAGLALWRGDPLADCPVAEWGQAEVDRLREVGAGAAESLAEADLLRGEHAAAVDDLERLVARHPLRERMWELLVVAHHRAGRQAEALAAYRRARAVLVAELGVEPGPELRRLEAAVLAGESEVDPTTAPAVPAATPAATVAVPVAPPGLVGRQRELADVLRLLDGSRLVTLTGPGGCGKTRLAVTAAAAAARPAVLVDLTPVADPDLVADAVATALGAAERPGVGRVDTIVEVVRGEQLVVLDNCEHLVRACAELVGRLLSACPGLTVLATSREALRVHGEAGYEVPPLAVPDPDVPRTLAELAVYDSVRLFLDRAAEQGVHDLDDGDAASVARLCAALDGLPLAIELAAARSPVLTPAQIVRRLRDRFGLLTFGTGRTLRATLEWSLDLLTPDEAALFARLAVFAGGFSVDAAEAVGASERTLDALSGLVAKSLVRVRRHEGTSRFSMLETIAAYAGSLGAADAPRRHAEYFLTLAEEADAEPSGIRLRELRADHDNLRAAMSWFAEQPDGSGELRLAVALCRYCHLHGHYREGRQWLDRALARSASVESPCLAKALAGAASLALFECDYAQAATHATAALDRTAGDRRQIGRLRRLLGSVEREQARYPEALRHYAESREHFRAAGDEFGVAYSHQLAGATAWLAGDLDTAAVQLTISLTRLRELDDRKGAASSLAYLGAVASYRGSGETARQLLDEALDTFGQLEFKEGTAWALNLLGVTEHAAGRHDQAAALLRTSLAQHRALGDRWRQASVLEALASVACATREPDRAALLLHQAREIREAIGAPVPHVERSGVAATYEAVGTMVSAM